MKKKGKTYWRKLFKLLFSSLWRWPYLLLNRMAEPVPHQLWLVNILFQRILRLNSKVPWMVHFTSSVTSANEISIGRNVMKSFACSGNCYIQGANGITIGDNTIFGPGAKIISTNHDTNDISKWNKGEPITIGKRCWIGANAVILPGVHLGDDVIVGAGAVVTKSFSSRSIIAGVPAKVISDRSQELSSVKENSKGQAN